MYGNNLFKVVVFCSRRAVGDAGVGGDAISRGIRCTPDWAEGAVNGDHLWVPTSVSGDFCYVGDADCTVSWLKTNMNHSLVALSPKIRFN